MQGERYLGLEAGPFRVALPLVAVRQILDAGGGSAPTDPRALGVEPTELAAVLGAPQEEGRRALLLFDGHPGPVLLAVDRLLGVLEPRGVTALPRTVATRWPGLIEGTLRHEGLVLILDPQVLVGLVEAWRAEGIKMCVEQIQEVREIEGVAGVHIMAIQWEAAIKPIVEGAGLWPRPVLEASGGGTIQRAEAAPAGAAE